MKITFGKVPKEFENDYESFIGKDSEGNTAQFYYTLDIEEQSDKHGMFTIKDSCDRYIPFDFEQLDELYNVINLLKTYRDDKLKFDNYWKDVWGSTD